MPPAVDVGGDAASAAVFAARARASAAAEAAVDLSDPLDPLVIANAAANAKAVKAGRVANVHVAATLPMSLQRVCPVVIKVGGGGGFCL